MERALNTTRHQHDKAKENYDKVKKMLLDLQAGIEHLCGKLNEVHLEPMTDNVDDSGRALYLNDNIVTIT